MRKGVIYKVSCISNSTFIVGSTIDPLKRFSAYRRLLENKKYPNTYLQRSYDKYGKNSIKYEILTHNIPENILECIEDIWIGALGSRIEDKLGGMNMKDAQRCRFSQEIKDKISKTKKENPRHFSEEERREKSEIFKRTRQTKEFVEKAGYKGKSILCYNLNMNFIKEFNSTEAAHKELGISYNWITANLKGRKSRAKKYIFKYKK